MSRSSESSRLRDGSSQIVVRAAEVEDRPRARQVQWSVGWKDAPSVHRVWPEADADWQAQHYYREIVAEVDGVIAARVGLEAFRQPFAELIDLCVRPEYRRLGLGEALTRTCQREAAQRGFTALFLQTELENPAAHRLYTGMDFVPTAHGKMLRLVKLIDCPLLDQFRRSYPLNQYSCTVSPDSRGIWNMEWHAYVTDNYLRFRLEGEASRSESAGIGPAITACDWRVEDGARSLGIEFLTEAVRDLEPGHHVELLIRVENRGRRLESGVFQMALPVGIQVAGPMAGSDRAFYWSAAPGERVEQPVVLHIEPAFDTSVLHALNYRSVPVCMEAYWEGRRVLLNTALPFAAPAP